MQRHRSAYIVWESVGSVLSWPVVHIDAILFLHRVDGRRRSFPTRRLRVLAALYSYTPSHVESGERHALNISDDVNNSQWKSAQNPRA